MVEWADGMENQLTKIYVYKYIMFTFDLTLPFEMYSQVVQADLSESCWFDSRNQGGLRSYPPARTHH